MSKEDTILRFEGVSFEYGHNKKILNAVDCNVRRGSKITIMGQNGAGKSTIFSLITGFLKPESGKVVRSNNMTVAISRQVIPRDELNLTVRDFFLKAFEDSAKAGLRKDNKKIYDIDPKINEVLEVVNLHVPKKVALMKKGGVENKIQNEKKSKSSIKETEQSLDNFTDSVILDSGLRRNDNAYIDLKERSVKTFSGGQQARLLLASALIQDPDLLLLDEPTNNLDKAGIEHLTKFLVDYKKTVIVISHDSNFLNSFSDGVLYLDIHTQKIEQYVGNYFDVVEQIAVRVEKENRKNAQLAKEIQENKDKANFFANKGGQMRLVAKRMREKAEELEEEKVDTRKEDKTIKPFKIPSQPDLVGDILKIDAYSILSPKSHKIVHKKAKIVLRRKNHLLLRGPNGIGKTTLLEKIANGTEEGTKILDGIRVGYYRQDFSTLNFEDTVYNSLMSVMEKKIEQDMRSCAASFLITGDMIHAKIGSLSEGQKGLVAFARLVLQRPGLLILDEPTNHINFRHIPVIAKALNDYEGAMVLVSHVPEFVEQIRIDELLDLEK